MCGEVSAFPLGMSLLAGGGILVCHLETFLRELYVSYNIA